MRFPRASCFVAMFAAIGLAGCGNTCFQGLSNNGNGFLIIKSGNPAPSCFLTKTNGMMRVVVTRTPACQSCTTSARLQHVFITLKSIELRPSNVDEANPAEWTEITPANEPRQIDLIGDAVPEVLTENLVVPAGSYSAMRMKFVSDSAANVKPQSENACGNSGSCVVREGRAEPLLLPGDALEISFESGTLVVLPDTPIELHLSLEPHRVYVSTALGLEAKYTLSAQIAGN
jgi:hypothetical protein